MNEGTQVAVPKRKTSKTRRDKRRATHHIEAVSPSECPQCHGPRLSHRVCPRCGTYRGRQIITVEE
jgi:large subunit ribosomal protein L32